MTAKTFRPNAITVAAREAVISAYYHMLADPYDFGAYVAHMAATSVILEAIVQRVTGMKRCTSPELWDHGS